MPRTDRQGRCITAGLSAVAFVDQVVNINRDIQVAFHRAAKAADVLESCEALLTVHPCLRFALSERHVSMTIDSVARLFLMVS